jgi:hypothetical protein
MRRQAWTPHKPEKRSVKGKPVMDTHQNPRLHEWIAFGKQSGKIRETRTVVLAYCMDERAVLPWIMDVVQGRMTEANALAFMERVIDFGTEGSSETLPLS